MYIGLNSTAITNYICFDIYKYKEMARVNLDDYYAIVQLLETNKTFKESFRNDKPNYKMGLLMLDQQFEQNLLSKPKL